MKAAVPQTNIEGTLLETNKNYFASISISLNLFFIKESHCNVIYTFSTITITLACITTVSPFCF